MNNIKFTYDKLESVKFGFSIFDMFSEALLNLFTFLVNTQIKRYKTFWKCLSRIQHSNLDYPSNGQTNKQTIKQTDNNCNLVI